MATTTNYGWVTPDDTDLVKDGAAAIRTLGSSADTTTKNLNPETTLGDLSFRSSTSNVNTRIGIGTAGQNLTVVAGVPAWAAPSGGGMTLITSGSLTGSAVDLTSISGFNDLQLVLRDFFPNSSNTSIRIRVNANSGANYSSSIFRTSATSIDNGVGTNQVSLNDGATQQSNSDTNAHCIVDFFDYANATSKKLFSSYYVYNSTITVGGSNSYHVAEAITQINIAPNSGNFGGGTYRLYGVK